MDGHLNIKAVVVLEVGAGAVVMVVAAPRYFKSGQFFARRTAAAGVFAENCTQYLTRRRLGAGKQRNLNRKAVFPAGGGGGGERN